jgi:DNA invertase Pin-like site-specific DNA recombinase
MLVGYARVSTLDQNSELQLDALRAAGCERIFHEKASGSRDDRPELAKAMEVMRSGDTLVVWKLDRLARSLKQLIITVGDLHAHGIGFRSLTDPIDTTTAGGELVFHMFGAIAQFERRLIQERTRAGLKAAAARGRRGGRPRKLDEKSLVQARAMLRDVSIPVSEVARRLGVSRPTLYAYLPEARSRAISSA